MKEQYLGNYLKKVLDLEMSIYQQHEVITHIHNYVGNLQQSYHYKPQKEKKEESAFGSVYNPVIVFGYIIAVVIACGIGVLFGSYPIGICVGLIIVAWIVSFCTYEQLKWDEDARFYILLACCAVFSFLVSYKLMHSIFSFFLICPITIILADVIYLCVINKRILKKNKAIDQEYNIAVAENNNRIKNNRIVCDNLLKISDEYIKTCQKTRTILSKLYDYDIIYSKYRGLIPVATFCEYFASGRCDSLEGASGAYNLYENEIRLNMIISKLDVVISKLDQIIENQRMLYDEMVRVRAENSKVCDKLDALSYDLHEIRNNSSIIEYNSRITAKNTEILKWMQVFDHINRQDAVY